MRRTSGSAVLGILVILGSLILAGVVVLYFKAAKHSEELYSQVIDEAMNEAEDPKYGFGAIPDEDLNTDESKMNSSKKPKPIVYVYPTMK